MSLGLVGFDFTKLENLLKDVNVRIESLEEDRLRYSLIQSKCDFTRISLIQR